MAWPDLLRAAKSEPSATIRYGRQHSGRRPLAAVGEGPAPHGPDGPWRLWQTEIADGASGVDLGGSQRRGIAVWNIDYRGRRPPGGRLSRHVPRRRRVLADPPSRTCAHATARHQTSSLVGHSAGGHLALWLAGRPRLPPTRRAHRQPDPDPHRRQPRRPPDLEEAARPPAAAAHRSDRRLTGGRYADTSVPRLAPLGVRQGADQRQSGRIIPTAYAEGYAAPMRAAGRPTSASA